MACNHTTETKDPFGTGRKPVLGGSFLLEGRFIMDETTITQAQANVLLGHHGIEGVSDDSTGSTLIDDLGDKESYLLSDVKDWLGY